MNKLLDLLKRALHRRRRSYVETILAEKPVAFYRFDVDDVKVFKDRILTPEEVQEHYKIDP